MAYSYTTTSAVTAHAHTNAAGQGGTLNMTTLINSGSLFGVLS